MNYREMIFFIGKCLSLSIYPEREKEIRKVLQSGNISWENLVWVSSNQMVLPALYVQLRKHNLLKELPDELLEHFKHLHQLNTARNEAIKIQALEITSVLNSIGIAPIFLKGTAHLLEGLYSDVGERMIGDIDFLVADEEMIPAAEKLMEVGYENSNIGYANLMINEIKHYPRLRNERVVAAIEVHRQPVSKPYDRKFNFDLINPEKKQLDIAGEAYVLSDCHQIIHNIMNTQMNDKAYSIKKILVRNMYDLCLLSQRKEPLECVIEFAHYTKQSNAYLILSSKLLGGNNDLKFINNRQSKRFYWWVIFFMDHPRCYSVFNFVKFIVERLNRYVSLPIQSIFNKNERKALFWRLGNKEWYKQHLESYRKYFR